MDLKLQPGIKLPKCTVAGCADLPTERLPQNMQLPDLIWCKPDADRVARMISDQDYKDFMAGLRQQGIKKEPTLTDGQEFRATKRRCCVPKCKGEVLTAISFAPSKQPGIVWVCPPQLSFSAKCGRKNQLQLVGFFDSLRDKDNSEEQKDTAASALPRWVTSAGPYRV